MDQFALAHTLLALAVTVATPACGPGPDASAAPPAPATAAGPAIERLTIAGTPFRLTLSADDASRQKGLGGVAELAADEGMLFVFPDAQHRFFWMKGCIMDIDIAFIDPFGFVTAVHTMPKEMPQGPEESAMAYENRLQRYRSLSPAQFAIELAPGTFERLGVKRGTKVDLDLPRLKALAK